MSRRNPTFATPPEDCRANYRELKSVDGEVVGYLCIECGRLYEAAHLTSCPFARRERDSAAVAACRAVVEANDRGMTAEEGSRAVEMCRAVVADEDAKGAR